MKKLQYLLEKYKRFFPGRQPAREKTPNGEIDSLCKNGSIGSGAIWDVYDTWI
jgi:hypothetical protein